MILYGTVYYKFNTIELCVCFMRYFCHKQKLGQLVGSLHLVACSEVIITCITVFDGHSHLCQQMSLCFAVRSRYGLHLFVREYILAYNTADASTDMYKPA